MCVGVCSVHGYILPRIRRVCLARNISLIRFPKYNMMDWSENISATYLLFISGNRCDLAFIEDSRMCADTRACVV